MNFRQRLTIIQKSDLQNIEFKKKKKPKKQILNPQTNILR